MRDESFDSSALLLWKIEIHVRGVSLKFPIQQLGGRSPQDIVDLLKLIHFILTRKQWKKGHNLKPDTASCKQVHLEIVVAICQQALGCPVPPCADVLSVWLS